MTEPILRLDNIHKTYGTSEVLKGVNMDCEEGEVVVIIGPSGTGKSTLLRCINLLTWPDEGRVWLDGMEITAPAWTSTKCASTSACCSRISTCSTTLPQWTTSRSG